MSNRDEEWWRDHDSYNERRDTSYKWESGRTKDYTKRVNDFSSRNPISSTYNYTPEEAESKTAFVQLTEAVDKLRLILQSTRSIPNSVTNQWLHTLNNVCTTGNINIVELKNTFKSMKADCNYVSKQVPYWDVNAGMSYLKEVTKIDTQINWVLQIVEHITNYIIRYNQSLSKE